MPDGMNEPSSHLTIAQCRDAALALVLLLLVVAHFAEWFELVLVAIIVLVGAMLVPGLFRPYAFLWWRLAEGLATVSSKVLLTVIYVLVLMPVGLIRRVFGADPMRLRSWGGSGSVLVERDAPFVPEDHEVPY